MVKKIKQPATLYSINYNAGFSGTFALDWDSPDCPGEWSISHKEYHGISWVFVAALRDLANKSKLPEWFNMWADEVSMNPGVNDPLIVFYAELLGHFNLVNSGILLKRVSIMSPVKLIAERRKLEKDKGLSRHEAISDTVGGHLPAEDYE